MLLTLIWTAFFSVALAAEPVERPAPLIDAPLTTGPFKNPIDAAEEAIEKEKTDAEKRAEDRLKAIEAAQSKAAARVVVLEWQGFPETNYENDLLIQNIKARIARPNAKFFPEIDLYQAGRKELDKTLRPEEQRAIVPDETIPYVESVVAQVETIPWNGLSEQDWGLKAIELRNLATEIWFVDRPELREPLFKLYAQIGNAAENQNNPVPPFYEQVGGQTVNYYWYLAAALAYEEPALIDSLSNQDLKGAISYLKDLLDTGVIPQMTLSFENAGQWNPKKFATDYEVFINGLPVVIDDPKGLHTSPPGRVDVYLKRSDGHSLSDRIELDKLDEKIYGVRDTARQRMGVDFIQQLMEFPNECVPQVDGDILTYLAIYQKLHPDAELYVAIPEGGSPNRIYLWRWVEFSGTLQKVQDNTGGFPVRFAMLFGTGMTFGDVKAPKDADQIADDIEQQATNFEPGDDPTAISTPSVAFEPQLEPVAIPVKYSLRGHYNRLMVTFGIDYAASIAGDPWTELYQLQGKDQPMLDPVEIPNPLCGTAIDCDADPDQATIVVEQVDYKQLDWQRLVYVGFGVVLGPDAAFGFGPYGYLRTGWYNAPHAMDLSIVLGYSTQGPFQAASGRIRPVLDAGVFGGLLLPVKYSRLWESGQVFGSPIPSFGAIARAGFTL